jgi:hypothetical protein
MGKIQRFLFNFHPKTSVWLFIMLGYLLIGEPYLLLGFLDLKNLTENLSLEKKMKITDNKNIGSQTITSLLAGKPPEEITELYLYKHPLTKSLVTDFFVKLTGNKKITLPVLHHAEKQNISFFLVFALVWVESQYNIRAIHYNRQSIDRGLFQLNSLAFPSLKEKDFFDPEINAQYGLHHLRYCLTEGKNDVVALAMYNAGLSRVQSGTPVSTLHFISKILDYKRSLQDEFEQMLKPLLKQPLKT